MCKIKIDGNNNKKDRTVCKNCYNKKKKKVIQNLQSKMNNQNAIITIMMI